MGMEGKSLHGIGCSRVRMRWLLVLAMGKPTVGISLLAQGIPLALHLGYGKTVWGKNTVDTHRVELRMAYVMGAKNDRGSDP